MGWSSRLFENSKVDHTEQTSRNIQLSVKFRVRSESFSLSLWIKADSKIEADLKIENYPAHRNREQ